VFGPLYRAMVRAGEAGGVLDASLTTYSRSVEKDRHAPAQVRASMITRSRGSLRVIV